MTTNTTDGQPSTRAARRGAVPTTAGLPLTPTGDRLPVPTRQRRPALAALAIVLILGGAALAATLVLTSGQKQQYLLVVRDVAVGQTLTRDDFRLQSLSATNSAIFAPVPVGDFATRVNGRKALVKLTKGALLAQGTFGEAISPPKGLTDVSLAVPEGQYPSALAAGDIVKILYTPRGQQGGDSGTGAAPTAPGQKPLPRGLTLVGAAYVTSVEDNSSGQGGGRIIGVQVRDEELSESPNSGLPALAASNAVGAITVVRLDPTSEYDKGAG